MIACRGNRTNAARILGVDRKTLAKYLMQWGIAAGAERREVRPGSLIAIEGLDGAGLTTQANRLVDYLNAKDHHAMVTSEPTTGPIGRLLREVLAKRSLLSHAGAMPTLSLLFAADRVDHFHRLVAPALAAGTTVVSDRWYHSSLAYQRTGVDRDWIAGLNRYTRTPDVTIFLDITPELGQRRRFAAGRMQEYFHDLPTQREVAAGYRATIMELREAGERIEIVDGDQSLDAAATAIVRALGLER